MDLLSIDTQSYSFSILIVNFNQGKFLGQALESIFAKKRCISKSGTMVCWIYRPNFIHFSLTLGR